MTSSTRRSLPPVLRFLPLILACWAATAAGQDLEPRSFSQTPVGMNFAGLALGYAEGSMLFDQATTLEDVNGEITSLAGYYVRSLDFLGVSSKASIVVPVMWGDWTGKFQGDWRSASRRGFADPLLEFAVNFIGAPAMKMSEMRGFTQKWVVGATVKVSVPVGQYYPEKLINLGTNRWATRFRLGASRKTGSLTLETMVSVWVYAKNDDFFGGTVLEQDPLWSLQFNGIYEFPSRIWFGLGAGFSRGGHAKADDVYSDSYKKNTRWAGIFSYPVSLRHSLKLIYISGLRTRAGSDFDQLSLAWSMRWGGEN